MSLQKLTLAVGFIFHNLWILHECYMDKHKCAASLVSHQAKCWRLEGFGFYEVNLSDVQLGCWDFEVWQTFATEMVC